MVKVTVLQPAPIQVVQRQQYSDVVYPSHRTIYVTKTGDDLNNGSSEQLAIATLERAIQLAEAAPEPLLIKVGPGTYQTYGQLDFPDNTALVAAHRTVTIIPFPGFEVRNVFRLGSGCFIEGPTFSGWRLDSMVNPTKGFAICFRPGAVINRVPYAHKIVCYRAMPPSMVGEPLDRENGNPAIGNGMGVCLADGSVVSAFSAFPNIVTWGATPSNPNGIGYVARNGALINAVNAVTLWAHKHYMALGGGQIVLSSCSSQFGDYSLWSEGFGQSLKLPKIATVPKDSVAATAINAVSETIINNMWNDLVASGLVSSWTAEDQAFTRRDAAIFLQAIGFSLIEGTQRPMDEFSRGFYIKVQNPSNYAECELQPVFDASKLSAFTRSFNFMRDAINALTDVSAPAKAAVTNLVAMVNGAMTSPVFRKERSLITAIGHQWTFPLSGVTRSAVPAVLGGSGKSSRIQRSIIQRNGGRIQYSGQDDQGNAVFVGGMRINARTGQLGGRPFDSAIETRAVEAAIASGV